MVNQERESMKVGPTEDSIKQRKASRRVGGSFDDRNSRSLGIRKIYRSKRREGEFAYKLTIPLEWIKETGIEEDEDDRYVRLMMDESGKLCIVKVKTH